MEDEYFEETVIVTERKMKWYQRVGAALLTGFVVCQFVDYMNDGYTPTWVFVLVGVLSFMAWDASILGDRE